MQLKMAFHTQSGRRMVEVYDNDGRFVAGIYSDDGGDGIKIVSKHFANFEYRDAEEAIPEVPDVIIQFKFQFKEEEINVDERCPGSEPGQQ